MKPQIFHRAHRLNFINPSGTSRGILTEKETFLIQAKWEDDPDFMAYGEAGLFRGLSAEDTVDFEKKLEWVCQNISFENRDWWESLRKFPSIQFGFEQILQIRKEKEKNLDQDLFNPILFPSDFTNGSQGISINGLIWMGNKDFMVEQITRKLAEGFKCLKLKIGVDWPMEKQILQNLRTQFPADLLEIRVDANGGFSFENASQVLEDLEKLKIHSIEQPIKAGNWKEMAQLCAYTPTPIALDEELIGIFDFTEKEALLNAIQPQYIILKPSLVGGFQGSQEWIDLAEKRQIRWWITSALESNIGLNAIAQWTYTFQNPMPQGLGTGSLFQNNFPSRLKVQGNELFFL